MNLCSSTNSSSSHIELGLTWEKVLTHYTPYKVLNQSLTILSKLMRKT